MTSDLFTNHTIVVDYVADGDLPDLLIHHFFFPASLTQQSTL